MIVFLETSALLACYAECSDSKRILKLVAAEEGVAVSAHSEVEFAEELRRLREDGAPETALVQVGTMHLSARKDFHVIPNDPLCGAAALLVVRHRLTTGAGMHLAAALSLSESILRVAPTLLGCPVVMVTLDPALKAAAKAEGLKVAP